MKPNFGMAALFVGDLHPEVTEPMLAERFSPAGQIHSIRLCRDWKTGSSLGYAYVNFQQWADAERALEMFHFELLLGQPMRVLWSQRDSTLRKSGIGNLFIKNLDKSIDSVALYDTFSIFGKVLSCKVVDYQTGSKGYGYVQFESVEAASLAMETLNGKLLNNRKVSIEHFKGHEEREAEAAPRSPRFTSIYIKNLGEDVDNKMLNDIFSKFGTPLNIRVVTDEKGKSKGFGFVRFERHEDAKRALMAMNGQELNGKKIYVGRAQTKEASHPQFKQNFEQVKMENNHPRGSGFAPISSSEARREQNGRMWSRKAVYMGFDQGKEEHKTYPAHESVHWVAATQVNDVKNTYQPVPPPCYSGNTISVAAVQYMPDVVNSASVHQQTGGTVSPSPSQVPCMMEESTYMTTPTILETVEVPALDSIPAEDPLPSQESVPHVDTLPSFESVPAEESHPSVESVPTVDTLTPPESVTAEEAHPSLESVPTVDTLTPPESVTAEEAHPSLESVPTVDTLAPPESVPAEEIRPALEGDLATSRRPAVDSIPDPVRGADEVLAPTQCPEEASPTSMASDVPAYPPAGKRLTIYMLESAPVDEQIQIAHDYLLPLVEKIHPTQAKKITWMLLEGENNYEIMNMIGDPEVLRARVDEMDALLRAGEAGYKPEALKMFYHGNNNNKKKKKKNKRNKK